MKYVDFIQRFQDKYNEFSKNNIIYEFGTNLTVEKVLEKHDLPIDTKVVLLPGGGLLLKEKEREFDELFSKHNEELLDKLHNDDAFAKDAIKYELANHEYTYTLDVNDALAALGLDEKELTKNDNRLLKLVNEVSQEMLKNN